MQYLKPLDTWQLYPITISSQFTKSLQSLHCHTDDNHMLDADTDNYIYRPSSFVLLLVMVLHSEVCGWPKPLLDWTFPGAIGAEFLQWGGEGTTTPVASTPDKLLLCI